MLDNVNENVQSFQKSNTVEFSFVCAILHMGVNCPLLTNLPSSWLEDNSRQNKKKELGKHEFKIL